jgi:hypothetical protein
MKNETLHLIAGLNNIDHILTNQSVHIIYIVWKEGELSAQLQQQRGGRWELPPNSWR